MTEAEIRLLVKRCQKRFWFRAKAVREAGAILHELHQLSAGEKRIARSIIRSGALSWPPHRL